MQIIPLPPGNMSQIIQIIQIIQIRNLYALKYLDHTYQESICPAWQIFQIMSCSGNRHTDHLLMCGTVPKELSMESLESAVFTVWRVFVLVRHFPSTASFDTADPLSCCVCMRVNSVLVLMPSSIVCHSPPPLGVASLTRMLLLGKLEHLYLQAVCLRCASVKMCIILLF